MYGLYLKIEWSDPTYKLDFVRNVENPDHGVNDEMLLRMHELLC